MKKFILALVIIVMVLGMTVSVFAQDYTLPPGPDGSNVGCSLGFYKKNGSAFDGDRFGDFFYPPLDGNPSMLDAMNRNVTPFELRNLARQAAIAYMNVNEFGAAFGLSAADVNNAYYYAAVGEVDKDLVIDILELYNGYYLSPEGTYIDDACPSIKK